ncbi:putative formin-like protein 3 isoform X1 [Iris pallida]|uniref:Formin-like protein 3 isoform X1 n=1 Tax=Iris pallida TaxID=29817 RepID=A0AAX6HBV9_IRIPA|nr:putative formin-like protein 3 isoform X1 [Iris pallida]
MHSTSTSFFSPHAQPLPDLIFPPWQPTSMAWPATISATIDFFYSSSTPSKQPTITTMPPPLPEPQPPPRLPLAPRRGWPSATDAPPPSRPSPPAPRSSSFSFLEPPRAATITISRPFKPPPPPPFDDHHYPRGRRPRHCCLARRPTCRRVIERCAQQLRQQRAQQRARARARAALPRRRRPSTGVADPRRG